MRTDTRSAAIYSVNLNAKKYKLLSLPFGRVHFDDIQLTLTIILCALCCCCESIAHANAILETTKCIKEINFNSLLLLGCANGWESAKWLPQINLHFLFSILILLWIHTIHHNVPITLNRQNKIRAHIFPLNCVLARKHAFAINIAFY